MATKEFDPIVNADERHADLVRLNDTIQTAKRSILQALWVTALGGIGVLVANHYKLSDLSKGFDTMNREIKELAHRQQTMDREGTYYSQMMLAGERAQLSDHGNRLEKLEQASEEVRVLRVELQRVSETVADIKREIVSGRSR